MEMIPLYAVEGGHLHHDCDMDWILGNDRVHSAVLLIEGFDHLNTSTQLTNKGWNFNQNNAVTGRFGGQAARTVSPSTGGATKVLASTYATLIFGMAVRFTSSVNANFDFMVVQAGATQTFRVSANGASGVGKLQVRNSGGTVIATGTTSLLLNVWYYVELKAFVNVGTPASGTCEVRLNGAAEIASTAGNFGSSLLDRVTFTNQVGGSTAWDFDDFYVVDTSGSAPNNTFLGDVRVVTIVPTSDGAHTDWTPSTGTTHWPNVDETTPNDDTDYNSDATAGHLDTYGCSDIDAGATVFGVQANLWARKDDAATRQIAPVIRQAGTDYVGTTVTLGSSYTYYSQLYDQDPVAAAWTAANVNADEFGVKTIA